MELLKIALMRVDVETLLLVTHATLIMDWMILWSR